MSHKNILMNNKREAKGCYEVNTMQLLLKKLLFAKKECAELI